MKNERKKEIEYVNPFNRHRHSGGIFKQRQRVRQSITNQQQNDYISISGYPGKMKKQRDTYRCATTSQKLKM